MVLLRGGASRRCPKNCQYRTSIRCSSSQENHLIDVPKQSQEIMLEVVVDVVVNKVVDKEVDKEVEEVNNKLVKEVNEGLVLV